MNTFVIIAVGVALTGLAQADVYKCTNPDGVIAYSQTKCGEAAPMDLKVDRPTSDQVLINNLRIVEETTTLNAEKDMRYRLWLSGKYLGGHNTYTETVTRETPGGYRRIPRYTPEYRHKAPLSPPPFIDKRSPVKRSVATIGANSER